MNYTVLYFLSGIVISKWVNVWHGRRNDLSRYLEWNIKGCLYSSVTNCPIFCASRFSNMSLFVHLPQAQKQTSSKFKQDMALS